MNHGPYHSLYVGPIGSFRVTSATMPRAGMRSTLADMRCRRSDSSLRRRTTNVAHDRAILARAGGEPRPLPICFSLPPFTDRPFYRTLALLWVPPRYVRPGVVGDRGLLDSETDSAYEDIQQDYESLVRAGVLDEQDTDPIEAFRGRIGSLRYDGDQLYRIWSRRHCFAFPYDLADVDAIHDTFADVLRIAFRRRRRNQSMNAILAAQELLTLEPLQALRA